MPTPKPELVGHPFTVKPRKVWPHGEPGEEGYQVSAPGFEDWNIVLMKKATGWRAYTEQVHESYSLSFGAGGHCVHMTYRAIRDDTNGRAVRPTITPEAMATRLQALFIRGEIMPA